MAHAWESLRHKASAEKREANKKDAIAELKRIMADANASSCSGTTPSSCARMGHPAMGRRTGSPGSRLSIWF
jgi:hypothetical protein